jgi:hypothetical protein
MALPGGEFGYYIYLAAVFAPALILAVFCIVLWSKVRTDQPSRAKRLLPGALIITFCAVIQPALRIVYQVLAFKARTSPELRSTLLGFSQVESAMVFLAQYALFAGVILCISAGFGKLARQPEDLPVS